MFRIATKSTTSGWCVVLLVALHCAVAPYASAAPTIPPGVLTLDAGQNSAITEHARLRVLVLGEHANRAHRRDALEFAILADYAKAHRLEVDWLPVFRPEELYERLVRGDADLAIGEMPPELLGRPTLASTHPLTTQRYQLIGRAGLEARDPLGLSGMRLAIRLSSPLWSYFEQLQRIVPNLRLDALPSNLDRESALRLVADGIYDATVLPIALGDDDLEAYPRLKRLFDLTDDQPFGWYLRSDHRALLQSLNRFIARYHSAYFEPALAPRDFAAIKNRGVLRVVTRVDPQNYFVTDGGPSGYEFELVTAFAKAQGLKLQVMVARTDAQMIKWLKNGAADLVTTRINADLVHGDPSVSFSRSYHHAAYALLTSRYSPIPDATSLRNKLVVAYANSPAFRAAQTAAPATGFKIVPAASELNAGVLLERVANREVDAIIVDGDTARQVVASNRALRAGVSVPDQFDYRWLMRGGDPKLLKAINAFLVESHREGLDAMLVARYFSSAPNAAQVANTGRVISPFDALVRTYAERYDFDWRLIAAQMYQESRFDPRVVSSGGATGLMQMLPETAKSLGFRNITEPGTAIHAGIRYLYELRNEFEQEVPAGERTWFALAAYNAGFERVERARRLAEKLRLDPNKWFGNVETAMLKFARPDNGAKPARGYGQAIIYVRQIQSLYGTYLQLGDALPQGARTWDLPLSGIAPDRSTYWFAMTP